MLTFTTQQTSVICAVVLAAAYATNNLTAPSRAQIDGLSRAVESLEDQVEGKLFRSTYAEEYQWDASIDKDGSLLYESIDCPSFRHTASDVHRLPPGVLDGWVELAVRGDQNYLPGTWEVDNLAELPKVMRATDGPFTVRFRAEDTTANRLAVEKLRFVHAFVWENKWVKEPEKTL